MHKLSELAEKYGTDKLIHGFTEIYDKHFNSQKEKVHSLLEIGIHEGRSLRMWRDYFVNAERIVGWDIHMYEIDQFGRGITTAVVNQERLADTAFALDPSPTFDVIVEDGKHSMKGQQESLAYLWSKLNPGGTFIIEDLHTSLPHNPYEWAGGQCLPDFSNSSLLALYGLQDTGKIKSVYMTKEQEELISSECLSCTVYDVKGDGRHITSILVKK